MDFLLFLFGATRGAKWATWPRDSYNAYGSGPSLLNAGPGNRAYRNFYINRTNPMNQKKTNKKIGLKKLNFLILTV